MDDLPRFIRDHYLQLEEQESARLSSDSEREIERHIESAQKLTLQRRERIIKAFRREVELRGISVARYFQPFVGSVILRDGEPFWGHSWIDGNYHTDEGSLSRARRIALERAYRAALREDATRQRDANGASEPANEQIGRGELGRSLVASIAIAGIRYEVTPSGREALKHSTEFSSGDIETGLSLPSGLANGTTA
ncbi:MAG: hypothetical protein ACJ796_02000 [Gemmatimonadaceae bacterium]